jgi:hypothetical protein
MWNSNYIKLINALNCFKYRLSLYIFNKLHLYDLENLFKMGYKTFGLSFNYVLKKMSFTQLVRF